MQVVEVEVVTLLVLLDLAEMVVVVLDVQLLQIPLVVLA